MSEPTDASTGAAHPDTAPPPEQTFFADPALDRMLGVVMALASEVYILRSRMQTLEWAQRQAGFDPAAVASGIADGEEQRRAAAAFVAHLLEPVLGEQQAKGPR